MYNGILNTLQSTLYSWRLTEMSVCIYFYTQQFFLAFWIFNGNQNAKKIWFVVKKGYYSKNYPEKLIEVQIQFSKNTHKEHLLVQWRMSLGQLQWSSLPWSVFMIEKANANYCFPESLYNRTHQLTEFIQTTINMTWHYLKGPMTLNYIFCFLSFEL